MSEFDPDRLDDVVGLTAADSQEMLRAVATSGPQIRASLTAAREAGLASLGLDDRPRAVVVTGMGGSGISGDVLSSVAGLGCPVPIVVHRGYGLPGWVGAADLVIAVSCSGTTAETLSATADAARRRARLVGVGGPDSPLEAACRTGGGSFVPVTPVLSPRSSLWALSVPSLVVAARFGLLDLGPDDEALEHAAVRLESIAGLCAADRDSFLNPAKTLAGDLAGSLPVLWGSGQIGPVAALRGTSQLAENAKYPAICGALPEAHHNQVVAFDGPFAGGSADDDLFRDRVEAEAEVRLRLVTIRDDPTDELAESRAVVSAEVASRRGIPVSELAAEGNSPIERLASLVGLLDYASVYLGLGYGIDPTPIGPIDELKRSMQSPRTL